MKRFIFPLVLVCLLLAGCAMERTATASADTRPCATNYSSEGTIVTGKQFKTFEDFPALSKATAFDNLIAALTSSGLQILNSNKESGVISASKSVIGSGRTFPVNAVVRSNSSGGTRVELIVSLASGMATSADAVQGEFCRILALTERT